MAEPAHAQPVESISDEDVVDDKMICERPNSQRVEGDAVLVAAAGVVEQGAEPRGLF